MKIVIALTRTPTFRCSRSFLLVGNDLGVHGLPIQIVIHGLAELLLGRTQDLFPIFFPRPPRLFCCHQMVSQVKLGGATVRDETIS